MFRRAAALAAALLLSAPAYAADQKESALTTVTPAGVDTVTGLQGGANVNFTAQGVANLATDASKLTTGTLPAARLPNPSASTLGGVQSKAVAGTQFLTGISTSGVPSAAQPAFTDISGVNSVAQLGGSGASHGALIDVAGTPTWKVVPDCTDTGGNHLNFTQSTDAFSCGTSGGGSLTATDGTHSVASTTTLTFGNGFVVGGSAGSATANLTVTDVTKTANYSVAAGDMANALNLGGSGATLTLPAASATIFAPGMSVGITVTASGNWTLTNSTGLTLAGLNSTTLVPGTSGTFVANADGTHLDFFPGVQPPTTTALGGVLSSTAVSNQFITGITTAGAITRAQPAFTDISGSVAAGQLPTATTSALGAVKVDGTTITIASGVITATAGGSGCTVSGAAGAVFNTGSSACTTDTTITATAGALALGASGTAGSVAFGNATSGTITLQPVTGALGSVTLSLPAATDTLVGKATTDTLSNKTLVAPALGTPASGVLTNATGLPAASVVAGALANGMTATTQSAKDNSTKVATTAYVDAPTGLTAGTSVTLSAPRQYFVCTGTCTITVPVPAAGYEFCVMNDDNVATVITLAAIGSSARYENTARTAYGTSGTGTLVSAGAVGDRVCIVGRDSTHYLTTASTGTWLAN